MRTAGLAGVCALSCLVGCGKGQEVPAPSRPAASSAAVAPTGAHSGSAATAAPAPREVADLTHVDIGDGKTMWIQPLRYRNLALLPISIAPSEIDTTDYVNDQGQVWQEVSAKNAQRGESNATDTYRTVALEKGAVDDYDRAIGAAYDKTLSGGTVGSQPVVGFAIAYNGEIVGIEAFRSPKLFAELRGKLMRSYYVEAIDRAYDKAASDAPMAAEAATKGERYKRKYKFDDGKSGEVYGNDSSATTAWSNARARGTEVRLKKGAGKARPKPVYESAELH